VFFTQNTACLGKNWIKALVFQKFATNCHKLAKIASVGENRLKIIENRLKIIENRLKIGEY
jgi:hypothetical protein